MKKQHILFLALCILPIVSFAANGGSADTTFSAISDKIKEYLGGSLGLVFVFIGFLGAAAAMAGFASMKVMFPIFGLTLALKFGPKILENIFTATGDYPTSISNQSLPMQVIDVATLFVYSAILITIYYHRKRKINEQ